MSLRLRVEQIDTLYKNSIRSVLSALAAAGVLIVAFRALGEISFSAAVVWFAAIAFPVVMHLVIRTAYLRTQHRETSPRLWANAFVCAAFLDGAWWGSASTFLAPQDRIDEQSVMIGVASVVAASAASAFGAYLPAFLALVLPTVILNAAGQAMQGGALHIVIALLQAPFLFAIVDVARSGNASFVRVLRLQYEKEALVEDLQRQKEVAEEASRSKSRFLASASHDLRQPIHALSMFVGALSEHATNDEMRRLIGHIETSIQAMDGLFGSLLDISRLDAGVVRPQIQSIALNQVLERVCRDYAGDAEDKRLTLRFVPTSAHIQSDPVLFERILRNLVSNAVRYTEVGGVLVGCRRGSEIKLQVWDTGKGVAGGEQDRIFDEFYQIDNPERDRTRGLGLGLAIVKRLAELLRHPLEMRSTLGKGSVFALSLPVAPNDAGRDVAQPAFPAATLAGVLILVIDDEPLVLEGMKSLLSGWGAKVIAAESYLGMVRQIADCGEKPDLILCDFRLPGDENGIDVIRQLQTEYNEDIPAVLVTGDTASDRLKLARDSGFMVLHKPVPNSRLRATISNILARRRVLQE